MEYNTAITSQPVGRFEFVSGPVTVKHMEPRDAHFVSTMQVEAFKGKFESALGKQNIPRFVDIQTRELQKQGPRFYCREFVAFYEGRAAGNIGLKFHEKDPFVSTESYSGFGCRGTFGLCCFALVFSEKPARNSCYLDHICVSSDFRGKGIGKVMMQVAENEARRENCSTIYLNVVRSNKAKHLYERQGYHVTDTNDSACVGCVIGESEFDVMTKRLY